VNTADILSLCAAHGKIFFVRMKKQRKKGSIEARVVV